MTSPRQQAQLRIAGGERLADLGLSQETIVLRGAAIQCRITAEDPEHDFRPDTGTITTYRLPGGSGIRLDEGTTVGTEVLPYFDSLLAKLTCRGRNFDEAVDRARRGVAELRIRGIATNVGFLQAILDDDDFRAGRLSTTFIERRPELLHSRQSAEGLSWPNGSAGERCNQPLSRRSGRLVRLKVWWGRGGQCPATS